jgi:putative acetyltransferase
MNLAAGLSSMKPRRFFGETLLKILHLKLFHAIFNFYSASRFCFCFETKKAVILFPGMLEIVQAASQTQIEQARELFREYEAWMGLDLCFQGFEEELRGLPGKYAEPEGRLLLAYSDETLAGCIALRKLEEGICEMKRLFVRDDFRGQKIGVRLIERLIANARAIGYEKMRLDTFLPKMGQAVKLYESHGFSRIPAYYDNPYDGVLFMELTLR